VRGLFYPALYALFVWWFSTGVVLLLDNLPRRTFRWSMTAGTVIFIVSLVRLSQSSMDVSEAGAYAAFTYAILAWAWQEMSFFMGFVTGTRQIAAPEGCSTWDRFRYGFHACIWHELAILATAAIILATTWGAPNQVGVWTFMLLWLMRTSAKLNVVLGVLNLGEEFLPPHLRYLLSFMARRPMNLLMPLSLTGGAIGAVMLWQAAAAAVTAGHAAGLTFLAGMLSLAVVEHWFLILPLPFARLWAWSLRFKPKSRSSALSRKPASALAGAPNRL
jgi:putative photosynthetic complex assembly protein 2